MTDRHKSGETDPAPRISGGLSPFPEKPSPVSCLQTPFSKLKSLKINFCCRCPNKLLFLPSLFGKNSLSSDIWERWRCYQALSCQNPCHHFYFWWFEVPLARFLFFFCAHYHPVLGARARGWWGGLPCSAEVAGNVSQMHPLPACSAGWTL